MNISLDDVESYRDYLDKKWAITPARNIETINRRLDKEDRRAFKSWRRRVVAQHQGTYEAFYEWMATEERLGPVHSYKWMDILVSGVWADAVSRSLVSEGDVLDLGCNAGYWTAWANRRTDCRVLGIDSSAASISYGRRRLAMDPAAPELMIDDFVTSKRVSPVSCAVSLQGLTSHFLRGDFSVLHNVAALINDCGYLVLVDSFGESQAMLDKALLDAKLRLVGCGLVGGLGIEEQWGGYVGLVLQKTEAGIHVPIAAALDVFNSQWEREFAPFCNNSPMHWSKRNSAYWQGAGAVAFTDFR